MIVMHPPVLEAFDQSLYGSLVAKMDGIFTEQTHTVAFLERISHALKIDIYCLGCAYLPL